MNSLCSSSEALTEPNGFTCVESETMSHSCYLFLGSQINKKPILPLALVTHSCLTPSQSRPADWWGYVNTVGERESSHLIWSRRTNKLVLWGVGGGGRNGMEEDKRGEVEVVDGSSLTSRLTWGVKTIDTTERLTQQFNPCYGLPTSVFCTYFCYHFSSILV